MTSAKVLLGQGIARVRVRTQYRPGASVTELHVTYGTGEQVRVPSSKPYQSRVAFGAVRAGSR